MNGFHSLSWSALAALPSAGLFDWLARITMVLALAWIAHFLMRNINPRWRILLWRAALLGLIGVAILALREPLLEFSLLPPVPRSTAIKESPTREAVDRINTTERTSREPAGPRPVPPGIIPNGIVQETAPLEARSVPAAPVDAEQDRTTAPRDHWSPLEWTLLIWTLGAAWGVLRLIAGLVNIVHIRRTSMAVPAWIEGEAIQAIGPNIRVEIRRSTHVATPCSVGIFRNTILLPADLDDEDRREDIRAALAHESAHFQGHDLRWNLLLHVTSILLWFHPLAWRIRLAHADACDQRCDAEAARRLKDSGHQYGRALARLALAASGRTEPVALSMARRSEVSRRIAILHSQRGSRRLSRWRVMVAACTAGCVLLGIGAVALVPSRANEMAIAKSEKADASENRREGSTVCVVDPQGHPIAGATVVPWIIDSEEGNGAWGAKSHGDPPVLTTNSDGIVVIPFPPDLQGDQRLPRIDLYCRVSHPEFVPTRSLYDAVPIPPETRDETTTISLQRGAVIEVAALVDGKPLPADDLYALTSTPWNTWASKITTGSDGTLQLPRLPAGPELLRIVHLPADAPPLFSEVREMELEIDEKHQLQVTMKPSIEVNGTLSGNVPRPNKNGRVVAVVWDGISEKEIGKPPVHEDILWRDSTTIHEDGTFTLPGMPSGQVQVIAICDGFVAKAGERPEFARDGARMYYGRPQVFDMSGSRRNITVEMIPTADASVHVVDPDGAPIENATVGFSPNMHWWGGGSQIYGEAMFGTAEAIKDPTVMRFPDIEDAPFRATTDAGGIAVVKNLLPGEDDFDVYHEDYEVSIDEINDGGAIYNPFDINLMSGKRTKTTVMLRPKEPERRPEEPATAPTQADGDKESQRDSETIAKPGSKAEQPATRVTGRVLRPDGSPAQGAEVVLLGPPNLGNSHYKWPLPIKETKTDKQGGYSFEITTHGRYELWADLDDLTSRKGRTDGKIIRITKSKDALEPVKLKLHTAVSVRVLVKDATSTKPIRGAMIDLIGNPLPRIFATDESGVAVVQPLTAERWQLQAVAKGYAQQTRLLNLENGKDAEVEFSLKPGTAITGTVRDQNGDPIEGGGVSVRAEGTGPMEWVPTDEQGRYRISNVPLATVRITASAKGYEDHIMTMQPSEKDGDTDFTLVPRKDGGSIQGIVANSKGKPIAGAKLVNYGDSSGDVRKTKSDDNGWFRLDNLYKGSYGHSVIVRAKGFAPKHVHVEPGPADDPASVSISLQDGHHVRGRVVDKQGKPINGVRVYEIPTYGVLASGQEATTDEQGRFQFDSLPLKTPFNFTKPGYSEIEDRKLPLNGEEVVTVVMKSEGLIHGRVTDAKTGKPINTFNVRITFSPLRKPDEPSPTLRTALVDPGQMFQSKEGTFKLDALAAGMPLQVTVSAEGYERGVKERVVARIASKVEPAEFSLMPLDPSKLTAYAGRLLGPDGKPVAGAQVRLIAARNRDWKDPYGFPFNWTMIESGQLEDQSNMLRFGATSTNAKGRFTFEKIPKSAQVELAWWGQEVPPGRRGQLEKLNEKERTSIELHATKPVRIIVTIDRDAFPNAASINFFRRRNDLYGYDIQRLEEGKTTYEFANLPEGTYAIHLRGPSEPVPGVPNGVTSPTLARTEATVKPGETAKLKVTTADKPSG